MYKVEQRWGSQGIVEIVSIGHDHINKYCRMARGVEGFGGAGMRTIPGLSIFDIGGSNPARLSEAFLPMGCMRQSTPRNQA